MRVAIVFGPSRLSALNSVAIELMERGPGNEDHNQYYTYAVNKDKDDMANVVIISVTPLVDVDINRLYFSTRNYTLAWQTLYLNFQGWCDRCGGLITESETMWVNKEGKMFHDDCAQPSAVDLMQPIFDAMEQDLKTHEYLEQMGQLLLEVSKRYDACVKTHVLNSKS